MEGKSRREMEGERRWRGWGGKDEQRRKEEEQREEEEEEQEDEGKGGGGGSCGDSEVFSHSARSACVAVASSGTTLLQDKD